MQPDEDNKFPGFPKGIPEKIHANFQWLKGTEWKWNKRKRARFESKGKFWVNGTECAKGACRWSTSNKRVYVMWGKEIGLHVLKVKNLKKKNPTKKTTMGGRRRNDKKICRARFVRKLLEKEESEDGDMDLYECLNIEEDATPRQIKRAFRKLSIKYHPDKNKNNAERAKRKFNEVREAYEVLSDPDKRFLYDTGGMSTVREAAEEDAQGAAAQMDPFAHMFGGGGFGGHHGGEEGKKRKARKGQDTSIDVEVDMATLFTGGNVKAKFKRRIVCRGCRRKPSKEKCRKCRQCPSEFKMVHKRVGNMIMQDQEEIKSRLKCKVETAELDCEIEKGMNTGEKLKFERMAKQTPGEIPGDVIVNLVAKPHPRFKRKGNHLETTLKITLEEALLGFSKTLTHLDGRKVKVERSRITHPNYVMSVRNEGMPFHEDSSKKGHLYVKLEVVFPKKINTAYRKEFSNAFPKRSF